MIQFHPFTGKHSFHHTSDYFDFPCIKGSNAIHRHSENVMLHIPHDKKSKDMITVECRNQKTDPHLTFTSWVAGLQCDFK
jgi:hypothetical protein